MTRRRRPQQEKREGKTNLEFVKTWKGRKRKNKKKVEGLKSRKASSEEQRLGVWWLWGLGKKRQRGEIQERRREISPRKKEEKQ